MHAWSKQENWRTPLERIWWCVKRQAVSSTPVWERVQVSLWMVTVSRLINMRKTFSIGKHERKNVNVGDCIRKVIEVDQKKQGVQNASLRHSRRNGEKTGKTSIDRDILPSVTQVRFEPKPRPPWIPQNQTYDWRGLVVRDAVRLLFNVQINYISMCLGRTWANNLVEAGE